MGISLVELMGLFGDCDGLIVFGQVEVTCRTHQHTRDILLFQFLGLKIRDIAFYQIRSF